MLTGRRERSVAWLEGRARLRAASVRRSDIGSVSSSLFEFFHEARIELSGRFRRYVRSTLPDFGAIPIARDVRATS
jgi:hypothetical protein